MRDQDCDGVRHDAGQLPDRDDDHGGELRNDAVPQDGDDGGSDCDGSGHKHRTPMRSFPKKPDGRSKNVSDKGCTEQV